MHGAALKINIFERYKGSQTLKSDYSRNIMYNVHATQEKYIKNSFKVPCLGHHMPNEMEL